VNSAPISSTKAERLQNMKELLLSDNMKLQFIGCALFIACLAVSTITQDKTLRILTMAPLLVTLGANCFRDRYVGPRPKVDFQTLKPPVTRMELEARESALKDARNALTVHIARFDRFQLIWGGVYVGGQALVLTHATFVLSHGSKWAEFPALFGAFGLSVWIIRGMFQRQVARAN